MFIKQKSRAVLKSKEREFGIRPNEESSILMVLLRGLDLWKRTWRKKTVKFDF